MAPGGMRSRDPLAGGGTVMTKKTLTPKEVSEHLRNGLPLEHIAYQEAGHAVIALRLGYEVKKVTIIPRRGS
jgi:ATP-dependent Zn protease